MGKLPSDCAEGRATVAWEVSSKVNGTSNPDKVDPSGSGSGGVSSLETSSTPIAPAITEPLCENTKVLEGARASESSKNGSSKDSRVRHNDSGSIGNDGGDEDGFSELPGHDVNMTKAESLPDRIIIGRISQQHAWDLPIMLGDRKIYGLLDTGANCSVMKTTLWHSLPAGCKDKLAQTKMKIYGVSGETLAVHGHGVLHASLGKNKIEISVLIAAIKHPLILGMDFIQKHEAVLDFGNTTCKIGTEEFFLERSDRQKACRLTLRRAVIVPPLSEKLVVLATSSREENKCPSVVLVQPSKRFSETAEVMARFLILAS